LEAVHCDGVLGAGGRYLEKFRKMIQDSSTWKMPSGKSKRRATIFVRKERMRIRGDWQKFMKGERGLLTALKRTSPSSTVEKE